MPSLTAKVCGHPGCVAVVTTTYCETHRKQASKARTRTWNTGSASARGYDRRWRTARAAYLAKHPLCVSCLAADRTAPATVVDHVVPHKGNTTLFWDQSNWQSLCRPCHDSKTARGL